MIYRLKNKWLLLVSTILFSCNSSEKRISDHRFLIGKILDSTRIIIESRKFEHGLHFLDSSFSKILQPSVPDRLRVYDFKQRNYYWAGRNDVNIKYLNKSLAYSDSIINLISINNAEAEYKSDLSRVFFNKGDVFLAQGKYKECYQYYYLGKQTINKPGTACENARFNNRFANLNYQQGYYKQAASLYMQEYRDNFKCTLDNKVFGEVTGALNNAGSSYLQINMLDSAMICFKLALSFIEHNENSFPVRKRFAQVSKGNSYQFMADVYLQKYDYATADVFLKKSIVLNQNYNLSSIQSATIKLGRIYLATQNYKKANAILKSLEKSIDSNSNIENNLNFQKLHIDYLNQTGKYIAANNLLPKYLSQKTKFHTDRGKLKAIDAPNSFYNLQKDYDLNLLKNENKLRSLYLIISLVFVSMLFLILYQVWRNWLNSKRNNNILTELNKQVTEQNLNLQEALMALEQSEQENKKIMKIIAHDLRSPIGAIVNLIGLLEDDLEFNHSEKHTLGLIKLSANDSIKFINELLNRESADEIFAKEPVELDALLKYCISLLKYKAEEKKQAIELQSSPIVVNINREKIWRVISNLITNAIKFSKPDEKIKIWLRSTNDKVLISVSDHGIGIPDEMKAKIFNPGADVKRSGTVGEKSYGIGLLISKQIIEAHGGLIWFESSPETGTTFFVELPIN